MRAAVEATKDIGLAVMATTFSLIVVFLPVSFMSSVSGRFLYQFGITATVAILVSLVISFSLTPMMSSRLLHEGAQSESHDASRRGMYGVVERVYMRLLGWSMRHRLVIAALALAVIASSVPLFQMVRMEYLPSSVDEGEFEMSVTAPEGASLASMQAVLDRVYQEVSSLPGVRHVVTLVGSGYLRSVNSSRVYVRLVDVEDRVFSLAALVDDPGGPAAGRLQGRLFAARRDERRAREDEALHRPAGPRRQHPRALHRHRAV